MPAVIKKFEGFTGGGGGINLFGIPELTASLDARHDPRLELNFNDWLYYLAWTIALVGYVVAWLLLRGRTGRAFRAVRDSETAARLVGRQPRPLQDARLRRQRRLRRRRRRRCSRSRRRSSTRTRSRSRSRSSSSSASSSAGSARSRARSSARSSSSSCRSGRRRSRSRRARRRSSTGVILIVARCSCSRWASRACSRACALTKR